MTYPTIELAKVAAPKGLVGGPFGSSLVNRDYTDTGIPVIRGTNMSQGKFVAGEFAYVSDEKAEGDLARNQARAGDLVFTQRGTLGQVAIVPAGVFDRYVVSQSQMRLRVNASVADADFVYYACTSATFLKQIDDHAIATGVPHINLGILGRLEVPMPSLYEQQRIAGVLAALDDKIAANRKLASTADELARSQFRKFVGRSAASEMADATYGDVAVIGGGGTPKTRIPEYWDGDIPWATPTDVTGLEVPSLSATGRTITREGVSNSSAKLYPAGSILMTSRATIGAFAIAENPVSVNQGFIVVNAKDPKHQWWLFHEMRSRVDEYIAHANGATFLEIPRGRFKALPVTVPDDDVVAEFSTSASELHQVAVNAATESRTLVALRDTLLPRLMSGELRVRDAEKSVEAVL